MDLTGAHFKLFCPEAIRRLLVEALGKPADAGSIAAEDLNASNDE